MQLMKNFELYSQKSTRKSAGGMSPDAKRTLQSYLQRYADYAKQYNYDTFLRYVDILPIAQNSKAFLANSLGRFLWIHSYITADEFMKLKTSYRFESRQWSQQHISNDVLRIIFDEIEIEYTNAISRKRNLLIVSLLAITGMRVSQLVSLRRDNIVITDTTIDITLHQQKQNDKLGLYTLNVPKTTMCLQYNLHDLLVDYLECHSSEFVIATRINTQYNERYIQQLLKDISDKYNIKVTPHTFRHEVVTRTVNHHGLHTAAIMAGHSSLSTTMRYVNPKHIDISHAFNNYEEDDALQSN